DDSLNSDAAGESIGFEGRNGFDRCGCDGEGIGRRRGDESYVIETWDIKRNSAELAAEIHFGTASALNSDASVNEMRLNRLIVKGRNDGRDPAFGSHQTQSDVAGHRIDSPHNPLHFDPTGVELTVDEVFEINGDWHGKICHALNGD